MERHEALLHACPIRLRPILMTSIATIAGALPPALALGPGAELQRPMALSIVGGMIVSTALHAVRGARGLQPDRRHGGVERRAPGARRRACPALRAPAAPEATLTVSRRRDVLGLVAFVVMCFGVSLLGGRAAQPALAHWYPELAKPAWTPPVWVFGPVWTLLYPLLAVAGWLAWREGRSRGGTLLFLLQLDAQRRLALDLLRRAAPRLALGCVVALWLAIFGDDPARSGA